MKKRAIALLILLPLFVGSISAQRFESITFKEAQERATKESKIILVDVTSAGFATNEAKLNVEAVLSQHAGVTELIDKEIIAVRVDMGTDEGKEFAPRLMMNMYPTYAFFTSGGDLLGVQSPFPLAEKPQLFIDKAKSFIAEAKKRAQNKKSIEFTSDSFDQALAQAKRENKLLFLDAYTDNCQPCMMMEQNIFTLDAVAELYNSNFINISLNLGTKEVALAERYGTYAYPTYLFINGDGELVHMGSGYMAEDKFIALGEEAIAKRGIQFTEGSWSEILAKAQAEDRPIFVDCYTEWCGPCKVLDSQVFTNPEVGDYFNKTFINVKIDMEKGEGVELKERYNVSAFPTLLYLDKHGEVINMIVGAAPADKFLAQSKKGMTELGLAALTERYSSGDRSKEVVLGYIDALRSVFRPFDASLAAEEYLDSLEPSELMSKESWKLFCENAYSADTESFKILHSSLDELKKLYGEAVVADKFFSVWSNTSRSFISGTAPNGQLDKKGYKAFKKRLKREGVESADVIIENADIFNAESTGNWNSFYKLTSKKIAKAGGLESFPDHLLYHWGTTLDRDCDNNKVRAKAAEWFKVKLPIFVEQERKRKEAANLPGGMVMAMSMIDFEKEFARLIESLSTPK